MVMLLHLCLSTVWVERLLFFGLQSEEEENEHSG